VLFLLSPAIGELLSGSSPPREFFAPFGFTVMALLYGGGALTARELKVRWGKGMGSLLLLGAAYGVVEEGLMVASFQNPGWPDLGVLGVFGRWLGVNWVWAAELTAYHAIVSITVPVMLVELAYPERRAEAWLRGRWLKVVPGLLVSDVVFGLFLFSAFTGFRPPVPQYAFMALLAASFAFMARRLPRDWARRGTKPMRGPRFYLLVAFLGVLACGAIFWVLPNVLTFLGAPALVMLLGALAVLGVIYFIRGYAWKMATPLHRFALTDGTLAPFVLFAFIQELDRSRRDDTTGMALVGLVAIIGLASLRRSLKKREGL
jgi:hypothetical protein